MASGPVNDASAALLAALVAAPGETDLDAVAWRVARAVAEAEPRHMRGARSDAFAGWIRERAFLPSIPTLANAGRGGQLAACFVIEPADSLDSIYEALGRAARIQQGSGGVGIHFSRLRQRGAPIARSGGRSPGPIAFMELFAHSAQLNSLAGRRTGAHLAVLRDDHPDVLEFVCAPRSRADQLPGLGLALGVSDALLDEARRGLPHALRDPDGGAAGSVDARALLGELARSICERGSPTLLFLDRIAAANPVPEQGRIEASNPCGEQPLLPGESCVLGSLQLPAFADGAGQLDTARLGSAVRDAVRFLDDVIEVNRHPDETIGAATRWTRKIGLGVMGFADLLLLRKLRYGSEASLKLAHDVMRGLAAAAVAASSELAAERGPFPAFAAGATGPKRRNATLLAVAPTGTIRLLAGCSGGLEPFLDPVVFARTESGRLRWTDPWLARWLAEHGAGPAALDELSMGGAAAVRGLSDDARTLIRPAWEIDPEEQLALQGGFQAHVDGAVSKTVHVAPHTDVARIVALIHAARRRDCKGVAFYRHAGARPALPPEIDLRGRVCVECGP